MAKYFKTPFAKNGDRVSVPESTQVDGSVSFEQGYGIDYERDQDTDPQAKDIGRDSFNGIFHDMTEAVGEIQSSGVAQWISGVSYPKGALVWRNKVLHLSISDANTSVPPSDKWTVLYDKSNTTVDKNNFIRAEGTKTTVVTDDITSNESETSREKVASAELVNKKISKENISQTSGNRTDYVMSEKSVTDLIYQKSRWHNMTGSRFFGVTYSNTSKREIDVIVQITFGQDNDDVNVYVDEYLVIPSIDLGVFTVRGPACFTVPQGSTYRITSGGQATNITKWSERIYV